MNYEIKNKYTRAVQREFNRILFQNAKVVGTNTEFDPSQIDVANDYLVMTIYWLTQQEVDDMEPSTFESLVSEVGKLSSPKK